MRRPRFRDHGSSGTAVQAGNPRDPVRETANKLNNMNGFEAFTCCLKGTMLDEKDVCISVCVCILRYTVRSIVQTKGDGELTELGHCRSESVFLHFGFSLHFSISSIVVLFIHLNNYIKIILNYEICSN